MPKVTFTEDEEKDEPEITVSETLQRSVRLPVNSEILESLKVGDTVDVKLVGKVEGMNDHKSEDYKDQSITVVVENVEAYPADMEFEDEAFESGFKRGHADRY